MKKILSMVLTAAMCVSLVACSSGTTNTAPAAASTAASTADAAASEADTAASTADTAASEAAAATGDYPTKGVTIVCPYGAGGGTDLALRILAECAEEEFGQTFTVVNQTGGSGSVGLTETLAAAHDGYTLGFYSIDLVNLRLLDLAPENINVDAFDAVCTINGEPEAIIVPADSKWETIEDFLQDAKDNPGTIQLANAGMGNIWHLGAIGVELQTGASFNHIPYDAGTSESLPALLGGHVDAVVCSVAEAASNIEAGELKALAVFGNERLAGYPDVPTMKELGYDVVVVAMRAIGVASDVPDDIKQAIKDGFAKVVNSDSAKEKCEQAGLTYMPLDAAGTEELLTSMTPGFEAIVSEYLSQAQ